jgi:cellulose biosynthesis protein BcsQ
MNHFLTDGAPVWSNKEVIYAIGAVLGVFVPATMTLYRLLSAGLRHRLAATHREIVSLKRDLESAKSTVSEPDQSEFVAIVEDAAKQVEQLLREKRDLEQDSARQLEVADAHRAAAENLRGDLDAIKTQFISERRRVERALGSDGLTWTEKVRFNAPDFRPLDERRMPIISVLNLKGGVGKTTLTANLGAALSRRGWKVLLIDLDLQGSLTSLFMAEQDQTTLEQNRRFIGDFLASSFDAEFPNLLSYTRPIAGSYGSALVGTVDTLAYAETNLTVRWLLREGNRDPRFILRKELHLKRISNAFDIVLLDCPPLINVCCVNALAASDSVLIPVMPSKAALDRAPVLLSRMLQFREHINGHLKVLGLVANRTWGAELTSDERNRLSELEVKAKNAWGENVPRFESTIRQSVEVRTAEDEHRTLAKGDKMADAFQLLAREVESRLPTFCRPIGASTPVKAEVLR